MIFLLNDGFLPFRFNWFFRFNLGFLVKPWFNLPRGVGFAFPVSVTAAVAVMAVAVAGKRVRVEC